MELQGKVVSTKMKDTAIVLIERFVVHPLYKKRVRKGKKYKVHDQIGVKEGDMVKIVASKPISKDKHFIVKEVIKG